MSTELRMLLAIVLSFLIFFLYQVVFVKEKPVERKEPPKKEAAMEAEAPAGDERVKVLEERPLVKQPDTAQAQDPGRKPGSVLLPVPVSAREKTRNRKLSFQRPGG